MKIQKKFLFFIMSIIILFSSYSCRTENSNNDDHGFETSYPELNHINCEEVIDYLEGNYIDVDYTVFQESNEKKLSFYRSYLSFENNVCLRSTSITIEGDPIYNYIGIFNNTPQWKIDSSQDKHGGQIVEGTIGSMKFGKYDGLINSFEETNAELALEEDAVYIIIYEDPNNSNYDYAF